MRTRIWHSDWKTRWLIRCVSAALLSFMGKQERFCLRVDQNLCHELKIQVTRPWTHEIATIRIWL